MGLLAVPGMLLVLGTAHMIPTTPGFYYQQNPVDGKYRAVEVRHFDNTGAEADGTPTPPGLLWAKPGDASWWNLDGPEENAGLAGWVWDDECVDPDGIAVMLESAT